MPQPSSSRVTPEMIRSLAQAAGVRPEESSFPELAATMELIIAAVERCEELNLMEHEPCTTLSLSGGPIDAEL